MLPDHLGGQITRHLPRSDASDPGELLAHDNGSVALGAFVDPDPAASGPEPVARPMMHVLVREVHLISQPAFYSVTPRQARSNSCSLSGVKPAAGSVPTGLARSHFSTSSIVSDRGRKASPFSTALLQSMSNRAASSRGTHNGSSVNGSTPCSSKKSSETQMSSASPPTASHALKSVIRWPLPSAASTRWRPRNPVPPRIRTSIGASFLVADSDAAFFRTAYDSVDDAVLHSALGTEYVVAVGVALYLLVVLAGTLGEYGVHAPFLVHDLPGVYLHVRSLPAEPPIPRAVVATSALTNCIVSYIASIAEPLPPGEFMYRWMSCSGSSASRCKSCAMITFATWSSTGVPRKTILSFNSRE